MKDVIIFFQNVWIVMVFLELIDRGKQIFVNLVKWQK